MTQKTNLGSVSLSAESQKWLNKLKANLETRFYSPATIKSYEMELRFFFAFYHKLSPKVLNRSHVVDYIIYIKSNNNAQRTKCHMAACSIRYFYTHIIKKKLGMLSNLFPKRVYRLPQILCESEVKMFINSITNEKHKLIISLIYGTGMRLNELRLLEPYHIEASMNRIKVSKGKGNKQRYTILPKALITPIKEHIKKHQPKKYLFEGIRPGQPMHNRSYGHFMRDCLKRIRWGHKKISTHSFRHCFATHLLDNGVDLYTIKSLLGHSRIESTLVYLHLSQTKFLRLVSPLDIIQKRSYAMKLS